MDPSRAAIGPSDPRDADTMTALANLTGGPGAGMAFQNHLALGQEGQALGLPCLSVIEYGLDQEGTQLWQHSTASSWAVSPLLNEIWEVYITVVPCKASPFAFRFWNMPTHCLALSLPRGNDTPLVTSSTTPTSILYHTCLSLPPISLQRGPWLNFPPTATLWVLSASFCSLLLCCDPQSPWAEGGKGHTTCGQGPSLFRTTVIDIKAGTIGERDQTQVHSKYNETARDLEPRSRGNKTVHW